MINKNINVKYVYLVALVGLICVGCLGNDSRDSDLCAVIETLNSDEQKISFLMAIWDSDQSVRKPNKEISQDSMQQVDQLNLEKIECYITRFGYPTKDWNFKANLAPWVTVHHSGSTAKKKENFSWLHEAYQSGKLKEKYFVSYLDRLYLLEKGNRLDMGSSYKDKDRIEQLVKELKLNH